MGSRGTRTVAGIDVGGAKKGAHLVILREAQVVEATPFKGTPDQMLRLCVDWNVDAVGIDAPCRWATKAGRRAAESALARQQIALFSTPTRELAGSNRFYEWMLSGELIYATFCDTYPLLTAASTRSSRVCFETFPHAITCAMLGIDVASARMKRIQRRGILENAGIDTSALKSIDDIDAALCAVTARLWSEGKTVAFGDEPGGYIVVPEGLVWRPQTI